MFEAFQHEDAYVDFQVLIAMLKASYYHNIQMNVLFFPLYCIYFDFYSLNNGYCSKTNVDHSTARFD